MHTSCLYSGLNNAETTAETETRSNRSAVLKCGHRGNMRPPAIFMTNEILKGSDDGG
jgi:hypothetical protein